jgi:opacity protein-like surface antigen
MTRMTYLLRPRPALRSVVRLAAALLLNGLALPAQPHELGFTVGRLARQELPPLTLGGGAVLQIQYGRRIAGGAGAALFGDLTMLASPLREVSSNNPRATRDVASLYVTPGLRVKVAPQAKASPYVTFGGGWAWYEQSTERLDGRPNEAPRHAHRLALMWGGGVDVRVRRWLAIRIDARDFYTGSPAFNIPISSRRHNVAVSGGAVLRWGR